MHTEHINRLLGEVGDAAHDDQRLLIRPAETHTDWLKSVEETNGMLVVHTDGHINVLSHVCGVF